MKYPFARSTRVVLVALLPACGGGDFTATGETGGKHADAAVDGSGSGGTTGDSSLPGTGSAGSGGNNSSGGDGSGGQQTGSGGRSSGGRRSTGGAVGSDGGNAGSGTDAGTGGNADAGPGSGGSMNDGGGLGGTGSCPDPTTWYIDIDQDGYGSKTAPTVQSCTQPQGHYTKVGGDCHDNAREVHPQLTQLEKKFFGTPYKTPAGTESFDYDCSGVETGDPTQLKAAAMCPALTLGKCTGSGYSPSNRGAGIANLYCGSQKFQTCTPSLTFCSTTSSDAPTPYGCN